NDNGTHSIKAKIRDKDGGVSEYTANVTIANVAPTATFSAPTRVHAGNAIDLALTTPLDAEIGRPSRRYAFDSGAGQGYGPFGASASASCPTSDNGTRTVKGKIRDKDGGVSEYTASVTIANVAPTATFSAPTRVPAGYSIDLALTSPLDA